MITRSLCCAAMLFVSLGTAKRADCQPPSGINLSWSACGASGVQSLSSACDSNDGEPLVIVGSVRKPPGGESVFRFISTIDIDAGDSELPAWWEVAGVGACRTGAVSVSYDAGAQLPCEDMLFPARLESAQRIGPSLLRLTIVTEYLDLGVPVPSHPEYGLFTIRVPRAATIGPGACTGCGRSVCIVFRQAVLQQPGDPPLVLTSPLERSYVNWQGTTCAATPTKNVTWGRLRSLYR